MTGALIAFAVLAVQLLIQIRSQQDANAREDQADRAALVLMLERSSNLSDLNLQAKDLSTTYLKEKNLTGANLSRSSMASASLQDSKLVGAVLSGVSLDKAQLQRADLRYATLDGASLVEANLSGANLDAATLTPGVDLTKADLSNASAHADLRRAVLTDANLVGAQLDRANLQGADFTRADMQFADLRGADLRGANLLMAEDLDVASDLSNVTYDRETRWPTTFYWPPEAIRPTRPRCRKPMCVLDNSATEENLPSPALIGMRVKLERAANDDECLPGWLVEDQPGGIVEARAPGRRRASFSIETENLFGTSLSVWASGLGLESPKRIDESITVDGSEKGTYALESEDLVSSQRYKAVHVLFIRGRSRGFHAWAEAPPASFSLFERDFIKLFAALGIEGDLFPLLRGGERTCHS